MLPFHNATRWLVLLAAVWTLVGAWHGVLCGRKWTRNDTRAGLTFTTVANVQLLMGLTLFVNSPNVRPLFGAPAYALSTVRAFFLTIYHPVVMLCAVVLAQAVYSVVKRLADDKRRFRFAARGYSLAVALMIAAIPWPPYGFGRPLFRPFRLPKDPAEVNTPTRNEWRDRSALPEAVKRVAAPSGTKELRVTNERVGLVESSRPKASS